MYKITHPEEPASRYSYLGGQLKYLEQWDATKTISAFNNQLRFLYDDYAMQAIDLVKATRTPAQIEQANALAAMLDSDERIYITNYNGE
jgi:hypothetical protein